MKKIIYDRNEMKSYKDFYTCIYKELSGKNIPDWEDYVDLEYSASMLDEFLWYCHNNNIHFIFKNFNLEKIENYKNYENYEWSLIFKVIKRFVTNYPNNKLEFINEEQ